MRISPFLGRSLATSILVLSSLIGSPPSARGDEVSSLVDSNTLFSLNLYAQLKNNPGNLFFSPYSISACLGMTYTGARGSTEQQMAQVLGFGTDSWQFAAVFGQLQREIRENQSQQGIEVSLANALWAQKGYRFLPAFLKTVSVQFGAKIRLADFVDNPETATAHINQWVAQETKDRIEDIVPSGAINDRTRLVLANAIYFKGVWTLPFEKTNTLSQPFYLSSTSSVDAPLMHQTTNTVYYMETNDFQAVELPYGSNQLSMVVVLPTQVDGLAALEDQLSPALLSSVLGQMEKRPVEIFLPRFTMGSSFELSDTLAEMGMPDAFDLNADFSGMDGTRRLAITHVIHKAWGEVDEEGTEAAAATVVTIGILAIVGEPFPTPVFRADHPFLFFIRDTQTGSVLFLGRLADPTQ